MVTAFAPDSFLLDWRLAITEVQRGGDYGPDQNRRAARPRRGVPPLTIPILAGFVLTGMTCGIFAVLLGLPWWVPSFMAVAIFAGSAEFLVASMLVGAYDPVSAFVTILIVNARHLFYGLSLLERFRRIGAKRFYVIYALCDETFSIEYASRPPQGVDDGWFMFWISLLNQFYWVLGCTLGALFGAVLPVQIEGISFAMTALFMVIFLDQWTREASHAVALAGFAASVAALAVFGADTFIVPALVLILVVAVAMRRWVEPACAATDLDGAEAISNGGAGAGDGTCSPCVRSHDVQDQVEARDEPSGTGSSTGAKGRSEEFARAASDPAYEEER